MIARFDHRPMLTALLALSTTVLFVVVVTLSTLLITAAPTVSPTSVGDSGNPADLHAEVVAAAAHTGLRPTRVWTPEARRALSDRDPH
jgi:hypothetical protein